MSVPKLGRVVAPGFVVARSAGVCVSAAVLNWALLARRRPVLRFRGSNHIDAPINLVLKERARHPEARVPHLGRAPRRIARVSKDCARLEGRPSMKIVIASAVRHPA